MPTETPKLLLIAREAARALSISERTLWGLTAPRGAIRCVHIGSRGVRYAVSDLQAWIAGDGQGNGKGNQPVGVEARS